MMFLEKIFNYHRWESMKEVQFYCGETDFKHIYDLFRWKILTQLHNRFEYSTLFCVTLQHQYRYCDKLRSLYGYNSEIG
jgi:hypothetical protein